MLDLPYPVPAHTLRCLCFRVTKESVLTHDHDDESG
jgi:hypothetical protein